MPWLETALRQSTLLVSRVVGRWLAWYIGGGDSWLDCSDDRSTRRRASTGGLQQQRDLRVVVCLVMVLKKLVELFLTLHFAFPKFL
jgi:hypothetical protein